MTPPHWVAGILCALLLLVAAQPRAWRPWVSFAVDRRGIFIRLPDYSGFLHVPWKDVGETEIGQTTGVSGGEGVLGVRVRLRLDDETWDRLTGLRSRLFMQPDDGWGRINLGNSTRDPHEIREAIEKIRTVAAGGEY